MTPITIDSEELEGLVQKWRDRESRCIVPTMYAKCADELSVILSRATPEGGVVTDEDVERACSAAYPWWKYPENKTVRPRLRKAMHAALKTLQGGAMGDGDDMRALVKLARRCLHTGFVWNDHNFESARKLAKREAEELGIHSIEDANEFISRINEARESNVLPAAPSHKETGE